MSGVKLAVAALAALPLLAAPPPPVLRATNVAGGSLIFVRNVYSQPLTAFIMKAGAYFEGNFEGAFSRWEDLVDGDPIPPGVERTYRDKSIMPGAIVPRWLKMQAAIYADGSVAGKPEKINQLIESRSLKLETTRELIGRIEKSGSANIVDNLEHWEKSLRQAPRSHASSCELIADVIAKLQKQSIQTVLATLQHAEQTLATSKPTLRSGNRF